MKPRRAPDALIEALSRFAVCTVWTNVVTILARAAAIWRCALAVIWSAVLSSSRHADVDRRYPILLATLAETYVEVLDELVQLFAARAHQLLRHYSFDLVTELSREGRRPLHSPAA